ncbi:YybH family protein [Hyalangium versicolor]|uniref:YybH family protein n=1 Tax=Hyalangium versicolor TaxID=2861190 RepID=UPI001CCA808E|nr:SgcJ/EcaC family oxidoreductase [Hyalangium versicolor]
MTAGGEEGGPERRELDAFVEGFIAAWNRHDAAAMATHWVEDGDLLNTRGHHARGRAAVEQLLASEHAGPMLSTHTEMKVVSTRTLAPGLVLADARMTVEGVRMADGQTRPIPMQVAFVATRRPEGWRYVAVRPYAFTGGF